MDPTDKKIRAYGLTVLPSVLSAMAMSVLMSLALQIATVGSAMAQANDNLQYNLGSVDDYIAEGDSGSVHLVPELGIEVREGTGNVGIGSSMRGPMVMRVIPDGPGARAGLRNEKHLAHAILTGAFVAGGLVFPPAMFGALVIGESGIGESHDTIIAVDSERTPNVKKLQRVISRSGAGPIVYLSVLREGHRSQIQVVVRPEGVQTE